MGILLAGGIEQEPKKQENKPLLSETFHPRSKESLEKKEEKVKSDSEEDGEATV